MVTGSNVGASKGRAESTAIDGKQSTDTVESDSPTDESDTEPTQTEIPLDQVFELLRNKRRRETLRYLKMHGGSGTLSDVAEHIAALENETTVTALTSSQRKRVYVGLYQCHLPKMDEIGVIDFDKNRGTIHVLENVEQVKPYLDVSSTSEWYKLYLSVTVVGVVLFVVSYLGILGEPVSSAVLFTFLLAMAAIGIVHSRGDDRVLPDRWSS